MPRAQWVLRHGRPVIEIVLTLAQNNQKLIRTVLADTGAGEAQDPFEFVLDETDCVLCGGTPSKSVAIGGAYSGLHLVYSIRVEIPALNFHDDVFVVGVSAAPVDFDGIACFRFLNRFSYGNFGNKSEFCLEL